MNYNKTYLRIDVILLLVLVCIVGLGMVAVASTTGARFDSAKPFLLRQGIAAAMGIGLAVWFYFWDYHQILNVERWLYFLNLGLLAAVLFAGHSALGAQRWIQIGPFTLQASETAKLLSIMTLASFLERQTSFSRWQDMIPPVLYLLPAMGLILIQPDLGTTLVFVVILAAMIYVAGVPGWRLALILGGGLLVASVWIYLHMKHGVWLPLKQYQLNRLIVFTSPDVDTMGLGYQITEAKVAIGSGGLWGKGLFHGAITQYNYLPEQFTDFIFAAFTEELGFVGSATLLGLFTLFIWRIFRIGSFARDRLGAVLCAGVGGMLAFHVMENVGMNLGVMPVAGIPLPYVSYGGTAMMVDIAAVGLVMSVWRHRKEIFF